MRFQVLPGARFSGQPQCSMWDAAEMAQSASLGSGANRHSDFLLLAGYRRYRVKAVMLTGTGPSELRLNDISFNRSTASIWQSVVGIAAFAAARAVFDFGEGTATLTNFMGPWLTVQLTNNGPDAGTYEIELWAQS